ncbi:IS3 family transposase (plasmid) [Rhodococcus sp. USK10]|nr:IS3 family transposase [Rhodococcus sp. USK10]QYB00212.1 IS3 family transposase [Rhodococcus sp. USK10]
MPKPYPAEFRRDVVAVARKNEAPLFQIAKDFGVSEATLHNWLKKADIEDGIRPGVTDGQASEIRAMKRRMRLLDRAGKRSAAPRCGVSIAGEPAKKLMYPLVRELAATDAPIRVPVAVTCRILGFSKQAFYHWLREPVSDRTWDEAHLINAAYDIHADDPAFGYRFIADELAEQGFTASERRVWRLCSQHELWSMFANRRGRRRKAGPPVHDDHVQRKFTAPRPNQLWLTDITEHRTGTGNLYLCAIKDVYSNRIVGYSIDSRMKASLAVSALRMSISRREPEGTVVHSDRGSQFRSKKFVRVLADNGLVGSMGRVGACLLTG